MNNGTRGGARLHGAKTFSHTKLCTGLVLAFGGLVIAPGSVFAQDTATLQRVEITGSSIKRVVDIDAALPIQVISADELRTTGVTSTEGAVARIVSSQSMQGASQSVGAGTQGASYANLRGIGTNKTLVLLNGRRVANFAFSSSSVDLNTIPFSAIDRIEVLLDGASAIYGTDAIGGVINFITKKNYQGIDATVNGSFPSKDGGGKKGFQISAGFGDLEKDNYNVFFTGDVQKNQVITAIQRDFGSTGVIPAAGLVKTSGTSFPGNFSQGSLSGNPSLPGCAPPFSLYLTSVSSKTCRFDYTAYIDLVPETETKTFMARGSIKLNANNVLSLEYMGTNNTNLANVAPDPQTGLTMTPSSPFYPKTYPGIDPTKNITAGWRMIPAGPRASQSSTDANRTVLSLEGSSGKWDYKAGLFAAESNGTAKLTGGYLDHAQILAGVKNGILNPFGDQTAAGAAALNAATLLGDYQKAKGTTTGVDAGASTQFGSLTGGAISAAIGAEFRKDKYSNDTNDALVIAATSLGASPYHVTGDRDIWAVSGEMLFPFTKELEMTLAARYDHYSDFGSTFNPKVAVRWTPAKNVNFRGSYNTGFRAPSLDEMYGPQTVSYTANAYDDPLLCPGGKVAANGVESRDCGQQAQIQSGGNPALQPEKSKTFTFGVALEPVKNLTASIDYWNIRLTDQISGFPEQAIFDDPTQYAARYHRCNTLSVAVQNTLDRCGGEWLNSNALGYVTGLIDNLGNVNTDGIDLAAGYGFNTDYGRWNFSWHGTWIHSYEYQRNKGDVYIQNVGMYQDSSPVLRWVHNFGVNWKIGDFSTLLNVNYKSGYTDENTGVAPEFAGGVSSYTVADLAVTYTGIKHTKITLGVTNLFDTKPPFTNQGTTFQQGYDPRLTDPTGRAFTVRAGVSF